MSDDALVVQLRAIFTDELDEQIQLLNDDVLALERAPGDAKRLRAVFRVMHTLKGASRAAGLPLVEEMCHAVENHLSQARDTGAALDAGQIGLLFETADALGKTRDHLRVGAQTPEALFTTVLNHSRDAAQPFAPQQSVAAPDAAVGAASIERAGRGGHVRVSLQQVDAIAGAASEIAGLVAVLGTRADDLAATRARRRVSRRRGASDDEWDRELTRLIRAAGEDARALASVSGRLGASARQLRERPFAEVIETLPRVARDVAREVGKQVRVVVTGGEIEADRVVLEALREPLLHLVRNAVDHGVEVPARRIELGKDPEGEVRIAGSLRGDWLQLTIADDGHGIDLAAVRRGLERRGRAVPVDPGDLARTIFDDGFSTRDTATTVSGRGVGLGIVRAAAERMGGTVNVSSEAGKGTLITLDVPVSIATMRVVLVEVGGVILGLPSKFVVGMQRADPRMLGRVDGRAMLVMQERQTPVATLAALLGPPFAEAEDPSMLQIIVLESGGRRLAVAVDDLISECALVLRPLERAGRATTNATVGTAVLSSGVVALVLSVPALLAESGAKGASFSGALAAASDEPRAPSRILVVDDSITSRTLEQSVLRSAGYDVVTAVDGAEAWRLLERQDVALVVSDVEMPHLDGFGLCARIRETPRTATLPVILVTSLDEPAQRARGLEAGADAYITKSSFDQDTLLETVRMLIGRKVGVAA